MCRLHGGHGLGSRAVLLRGCMPLHASTVPEVCGRQHRGEWPRRQEGLHQGRRLHQQQRWQRAADAGQVDHNGGCLHVRHHQSTTSLRRAVPALHWQRAWWRHTVLLLRLLLLLLPPGRMLQASTSRSRHSHTPTTACVLRLRLLSQECAPRLACGASGATASPGATLTWHADTPQGGLIPPQAGQEQHVPLPQRC